jgi:hypothetical protein
MVIPTPAEFARARRERTCPYTWRPSRCSKGQLRLVRLGDESLLACGGHAGRLRALASEDDGALERVLTRAFAEARA